MTRIDGFGNRYEQANPKTFDCPKGMVCVHKNNEKGVSAVPKELWEKWEQVSDSKVEQGEMF